MYSPNIRFIVFVTITEEAFHAISAASEGNGRNEI